MVSKITAFLQDKQAIHFAKTATICDADKQVFFLCSPNLLKYCFCLDVLNFPQMSCEHQTSEKWESERTLLNTFIKVPLLVVIHFNTCSVYTGNSSLRREMFYPDKLRENSRAHLQV